LNLGSDIPVISTVFGAAAAGGFATIPQSSFNYRKVGVNLDMTPRVTYEGEIVLDLTVENSSLGAPVDVGGQNAPSFTSRQVHTFLRLREGEANLLAGLIRQDTTRTKSGFPGLMHIPGIKQLFTGNEDQDQDTDIVMLITPHIVRSQELTPEDLASIYIGTQQNVGLSGPPPLIAPQPETETPAPAAQPANPAGGAQAINQPPPGMPTTGAAPAGAQNPNAALPPGTSPIPGVVPPLPPSAQPAGGGVQPTAPSGVPAGGGAVAQPGAVPPLTGGVTPAVPETPPRAQPAQPSPEAPAGAAPSPTPAQIIATPPGTEFRVDGGPYTMPISINNASRVSVLSLSISYNPAVLKVRTVRDGAFMRQGGIAATFAPRIDAAAGRVDIAVSRTGDQTGASGGGLIAALIFDAVAPGSSQITVSGVANTPDGTPVTLNFSPVTVTVR
jgi:general secretion pathway protein D